MKDWAQVAFQKVAQNKKTNTIFAGYTFWNFFNQSKCQGIVHEHSEWLTFLTNDLHIQVFYNQSDQWLQAILFVLDEQLHLAVGLDIYTWRYNVIIIFLQGVYAHIIKLSTDNLAR